MPLSKDIDLQYIYNCADELGSLYRDELQNIDAKASGTLQSFKVGVEWDGSTLYVKFLLPDYWYYIEEGRGPTVNDEGGVLYPKILQWVQDKGIVPKKGSSVADLASAITKAIHREGYFRPGGYGKHPLQHALTKATASGLVGRITHSVVDTYGSYIRVSLAELVT